jgi:hypothetical protein
MEDVRRLAQQQVAGAGISAAPEPDDPAPDDSAWGDLRSADRVLVQPEAALCKPDEVRSAAQSCAAPELQGAGAQLAASARGLAARRADLRSPARAEELMVPGPLDSAEAVA